MLKHILHVWLACIPLYAATTPVIRTVRAVDTIADLVSITPSVVNPDVQVLGRNAVSDGGGGTFRWVAGATTTTNLGTVFSTALGAGRWIRQYSGPVNVRWFGADPSGTNDTTAAFTNACGVARAGNNSSVTVPVGNYLLTSVDVTGVAIEGDATTHTTTSQGYFGTVLIHSPSATDDLLYIRPTPGDTNYLAKRAMIRNLVLLGKRESNLKNPVNIVSNSVSRTVFYVSTNDLPANDPDNKYLASPYFNLCFLFSDENRYLGSGLVKSVNRTSGAVTLSANSDLYSVRNPGSGYLEAGFKVCFSEYNSETNNVGAIIEVSAWDASRAGYCAIDTQGTSIFNVLENVYIYGFHCAFRKGVQLYNNLNNFHVRACSLAAYWHAFPGSGSDDLIGTMVCAGAYQRELTDNSTLASEESGTFFGTYRQTYNSFHFGGGATEVQTLAAYDSIRHVVANTAEGLVIRSCILDRSQQQSIFLNNSSVAINVATIRGNGLVAGNQDLIANSTSKLSINQLFSIELQDRYGDAIVRHPESTASTTIFNLVDLNGHTRLQDPAEASLAWFYSSTGTTLSLANVLRGIYMDSGSPEGVKAASPGSLFLRTDGSTNTTLYVKESGTGNTGWVAK